jgi:hypothetical protein
MDLRQYPGGRGARGSRYIGDTLVDFGVAKTLRAHLTLAEVNAGAPLLPALFGVRWQLLEWTMLARGGNAGGATSLNISGIREGSAVHLAVTAIAALVRSAIVRAGSANAVVLADGESFEPLDVYTAVTCVSVGMMTTATSFDVTISYLANEGTHTIH